MQLLMLLLGAGAVCALPQYFPYSNSTGNTPQGGAADLQPQATGTPASAMSQDSESAAPIFMDLIDNSAPAATENEAITTYPETIATTDDASTAPSQNEASTPMEDGVETDISTDSAVATYPEYTTPATVDSDGEVVIIDVDIDASAGDTTSASTGSAFPEANKNSVSESAGTETVTDAPIPTETGSTTGVTTDGTASMNTTTVTPYKLVKRFSS